MAKRKQNQTAISDEEIIAALISSGSIQQAAREVGLSARAIYDRMGTRDFKAAYSAAKSDIVRAAVISMNQNMTQAVQVIIDVMNNRENPAATRLTAAKLILENAAKFTDRLNCSDSMTAHYAESPFSLNLDKWDD